MGKKDGETSRMEITSIGRAKKIERDAEKDKLKLCALSDARKLILFTVYTFLARSGALMWLLILASV